jgi:hypothetical protein
MPTKRLRLLLDKRKKRRQRKKHPQVTREKILAMGLLGR